MSCCPHPSHVPDVCAVLVPWGLTERLCGCLGEPHGQLTATPWARNKLAALRIGRADLAARIPAGCLVALSGRSGHGPWVVRAYRHGREVTPFDRYAGDSPDLGHAIEWALGLLEGVTSAG